MRSYSIILLKIKFIMKGIFSCKGLKLFWLSNIAKIPSNRYFFSLCLWRRGSVFKLMYSKFLTQPKDMNMDTNRSYVLNGRKHSTFYCFYPLLLCQLPIKIITKLKPLLSFFSLLKKNTSVPQSCNCC